VAGLPVPAAEKPAKLKAASKGKRARKAA
jgi:hypothetical protein